MLRNYLKIALRNLMRQKVHSFINIAGLSIGMACFLLVILYVQFERSYDSFHEKGKSINQMVRVNSMGDEVEPRVNTGAPLAPLLLENFPAVERAVRLTCFNMELVGYKEKRFIESRFFFADKSFFEIFTFPLLKGDPAAALSNPFSVVVTEEMARKYFGSDDPIDKVLSYNHSGQKFDFKVSGVLAKLPRNSHLDFDFLASYESLQAIVGDWFLTKHWDSPTWTYVLLSQGTSPESLERMMPSFVESHVDKGSYSAVDYELLPLSDVYYHSPGPFIGRRGDPQFTFILTMIAAFILLIACINFMNLATARSGSRSKEIGVRKVVGANRFELVKQFIGESLVQSFIALVLAIFLMELFLPALNSFLGEELKLGNLMSFRYVLTMILTTVAVGIFAGSYPALFLSSFNPVSVLKEKAQSGRSAAWIRKALVVGQFVLSIALIACSIFMLQQMNFVKNRDLGFDKSHLITIPVREYEVRNKYELLKNRWLQNPNIIAVTATSMEPGVGSPNGINMKARNVDDLDMAIIYVGHDYLKTLGVKLARGRDFSKDISTDAKEAVLINQSALERFGWEDGLGEKMELYFKEEGRIVPIYQARVIGILPDFHFRDLTVHMQPMLFKLAPGRFDYILIRVDGNHVTDSIEFIKKTWEEFQFEFPLEFTFLEDDMRNVYSEIENFSAITRYGTFWAILIACLGLFGLASFTVEKRTKEIGIRKALGASVPYLIRLINREFLVLVALANVIAWPLAYYATVRFLQNFAFRVSIQIWVFLLAGGLALVISSLAVSYQSIKAALANPVDALRYE